MKSIIIKSAAALAVGFLTATTAAFADTAQDNSTDQSAMSKVEHGTVKAEHGTERVARETWHGSKHLARDTVSGSKRIADKSWMESKKVARTVVHSPVIAYDDLTGKSNERTASRNGRHREQFALAGHRNTEMTPPSNQTKSSAAAATGATSVQPAGPMQGRSTDMNRQQQTGSPAGQGKSTPPPI
jgi:hypothetical protein